MTHTGKPGCTDGIATSLRFSQWRGKGPGCVRQRVSIALYFRQYSAPAPERVFVSIPASD